MRRSTFIIASLFLLTVVVAACSFSSSEPGTSEGSSSSSVASGSLISTIPTRNVSYVGTIEELSGTSSEGTHELLLSDGSTILLESTDANLNLTTYLGKRVEARGSVQPLTSSGSVDSPVLMRVEEVTVLEPTAASESSVAVLYEKCGGFAGFRCSEGLMCIDDPSDECDPKNGGADCIGICVPASSSSVSSVPVATSSSMQSSAVKSSSATFSTSSSRSSSKSSVAETSASSSSETIGVASEEQIVLMSKQAYDVDSLWTQQYCTSHIAFCIPVHKNWYFKSFGATTSQLWHVEFGMGTIDALGQGPIVLNLVSGTTTSLGLQNGQVRVQGTDVVGFKDWQDGNHFELVADARLKEAVSYMLSHITAYNPGE